MNARERKIVRDAHLARLGGKLAKVRTLSGHIAILQDVVGHNTAQITFPCRVGAAAVPTIFERRAEELQRA